MLYPKSEVTVVITSCNRSDLLQKTIESFLKYNSYPIAEYIIIEDSGIEDINSDLISKYPSFKWINSTKPGFQIRAIDEAYAMIKTKYVFHLEDDWETYKDGAIEQSIKILENNDKISAVMCRNHNLGVYHMSDNPPLLNCWGGWGHYSFNPGLRRVSDYHTFFKSSFYEFGKAQSATTSLRVERKINDFYKNIGYKMALTLDPEGYIKHIGDNRHVKETPRDKIKIGLCMIVKNEEHIIEEVLSSTLPIIDTYCIVDTGSSDNTIDTIKNFYKKQNISGQVHERSWKNFGHNRSEALALCNNHMDYILVMDADDLIIWSGDGKAQLLDILKNSPNAVQFLLTQDEQTMFYNRNQIFKANDGWRYEGVLHEYATNEKVNTILDAPKDMHIISRRLGDRNKNNNKMKQDIEILLKAIEEEPNNERYIFYLAQSYRDDNQIEEAIKWYKKRYEMNGWYEEKYIAAYNVAKLAHDKEWAWRAHECNPKRIECLVSYMSHCRLNNEFSKELLAMAIYASSIPKPKDQALFIEHDIYDWKVWDELSLIAYYCDNKDLAIKAYYKIIENDSTPQEHLERIKKNYEWFVG
jgi:glycosyltransferase involved in cell wall biosynthesis